MFNIIQDGLTFDDVLLVPKYSEIESRSKVDISIELGGFKYSHPFIPSNMKTITGRDMAVKIAETGGLAILHRFMPFQEQLDIAEDVVDHHGKKHNLAISVGVKANDLEYVDHFYSIGVNKICIDIAHGDSKACVNMISKLRNRYKDILIIAGSVATGEGALRLWEAGAQVVRAGVGNGSICLTRIETGNGVPQLSALMDIYNTRSKLPSLDQKNYQFISDGGMRNVGDIVKSLCFADAIMTGNMFAGTDETPGSIMNIDGRLYKEYVGSSTHKTNHIEGVMAMVPYKGTVDAILTKMSEGLRSGCSYQGAQNLTVLKDNPTFIRMTSAGLKESHAHDVIVR